MRSIRALIASSRVRLVLAFLTVVVIALALVMASLPRLLDGYFARQEQQALAGRTRIMTTLIVGQLIERQNLEGGPPRQIVTGEDPPVASDMVYRALGRPDDGYVASLVPEVAQADVVVTIAESPDRPDAIAYRLDAPLAPDAGQIGQGREQIEFSQQAEVPDCYWVNSPRCVGAPLRLITVTLSNPFSFRAQTLETIVGVLFGAALLAMLVAVVAAILLAQRLTDPIRRLTQASRALAEGRLDARVPVPGSGSPEVAELAAAFNAMAERLQGSIQYISRDRDRSREFLADVSHELRTPIAALRTFNELLRDGATADPATRDEFLGHSRQQIERLDWLATNLLELSKLDSGLVSLDLRPDDLRAVIDDAIAQAAPGASRKGVELAVDLPPEPVRVPHDPPRIGQVLVNLLGNGVKFTPAGGRVKVSLRSEADGATITVSDTGVGIDPSELPHVFERFYRGSQDVEERGSGSGLGLSIVRSIVEMHHGRVSIQSTPGKGTIVTVRLPREVALPPRPVSVSSSAASRQ